MKDYLRISVLILASVSISNALTAKEHGHDEHEREHQHNWEIGGALGAVFNIQESHLATGIHAHFIKNLGKKKHFGVGLGFETILDEHKHLNFGIPVNYNTHKGISFTVTPGLLLKKEPDWERGPSIHFETLYEFFFEHIHIGPMFEIAIAPGDYHFMLGFHIGLGWGE